MPSLFDRSVNTARIPCSSSGYFGSIAGVRGIVDGDGRPPRASQSRRNLRVPSLTNKKPGMRNAPMGRKARRLPAEDGTGGTESKNQKATMRTGLEGGA